MSHKTTVEQLETRIEILERHVEALERNLTKAVEAIMDISSNTEDLVVMIGRLVMRVPFTNQTKE